MSKLLNVSTIYTLGDPSSLDSISISVTSKPKACPHIPGTKPLTVTDLRLLIIPSLYPVDGS